MAYQAKFYNSRHSNTLYSARTILKIVNKFVSPRSVVDVGCGVGTWLSVFGEFGVTDILGVEGHWVDEKSVVIPSDQFKKTDLENPLQVDRKFDLAITMEVAEHIHESSADQFVENLVNLAPVVLFSAAIPLQGGKHHVNERWPVYWKEKFAKHNYVILDCIRPEVWEDEGIELWYAQNSFIYVDKNKLADYPELQKRYVEHPTMLSVVHPRFYEFKLKSLPIMKAVRNKINRSFGKKG